MSTIACVGLGRRALLVGVLDAQDEGAAVMARERPGEQRGADVAEVQEPGGAGREAGADHSGIRHQRIGIGCAGSRTSIAGAPCGRQGSRLPPQIQCRRHRGIRRFVVHGHRTRRMAMRPEARKAARFGFVGIDRKRVVVAPARVRRRDTCSRRARAATSGRRDRSASGACTPIVGCSADGGLHARSARRRRIRRERRSASAAARGRCT